MRVADLASGYDFKRVTDELKAHIDMQVQGMWRQLEPIKNDVENLKHHGGAHQIELDQL